jgi:hypothetical protein
MAILIKWLGRTLFVIAGVDLIACFYFKSRAIDEMHDPACCKDAVSFSSLTDHPVLISHGTAFGYHLTEWIFLGCFCLMAALHAAGRRFNQSSAPTETDR